LKSFILSWKSTFKKIVTESAGNFFFIGLKDSLLSANVRNNPGHNMGEGRVDTDLPLLQQKIKAVTVAIGVRAGEARAGGGVQHSYGNYVIFRPKRFVSSSDTRETTLHGNVVGVISKTRQVCS